MITPAHPVVLAAALGAVFALAALIAACLVRRTAARVTFIVLAAVCLLPVMLYIVALNPWLIDGRFRTYRAFYRDIEIGMTRDQVFQILEKRYPTNGVRQRPKVLNDTVDGLGFFMNPESSTEPNCEGIFLKLLDGKVIARDYSSD